MVSWQFSSAIRFFLLQPLLSPHSPSDIVVTLLFLDSSLLAFVFARIVLFQNYEYNFIFTWPSVFFNEPVVTVVIEIRLILCDIQLNCVLMLYKHK